MEFNSRCNGNLKVRLEFDENALVKDFLDVVVSPACCICVFGRITECCMRLEGEVLVWTMDTFVEYSTGFEF